MEVVTDKSIIITFAIPVFFLLIVIAITISKKNTGIANVMIIDLSVTTSIP